MRPIKTILLLQDLQAGGTQRHAVELARRLAPERFDARIWTLLPGGDFAPMAREHGLRVRELSQGAAVGPAALWGLWRALRAERPDVLAALTVVPNIWGRVLGRLAGVAAVVANCRGGDDLWRQHESVLKNLACLHVCNAQALKDALMTRYGLPGARVEVIPTGVDTARFAPDPAQREPGPVILCVARLAPIKDHVTLIEAFESLSPAHPGAKLRLVGDGPSREALAARIAESPARSAMELLPGTPDPRPQYARASIVALSSVNEGMPNVLLEAMSMGLPCVGTDVGGVAEVIRHGETGFVVRKKDPGALAGALGNLLADEGLREGMGRAGRAAALEHHCLDRMAERHARVIEEAHASAARR